MLRTVPETINDEIDLFLRTYYSLLRSSQSVRVRSLEEAYVGTRASLHPHPDVPEPDLSAFTYAVARLPGCIHSVRTVLLAQSDEVLAERAGVDLSQWTRVHARARRRKAFFDGESTLACHIASVSDVDDIIPILVCFQIEWNKIHLMLQRSETAKNLCRQGQNHQLGEDSLESIRKELDLSQSDFGRLRSAWGQELSAFLAAAASHEADIELNSLAGSLADYRQAVSAWWGSVVHQAGLGSLRNRSIYFVSSNPHAIPNMLMGWSWEHRDALCGGLAQDDPEALGPELEAIRAGGDDGAFHNLLYYLTRGHFAKHREDLKAYRQLESQYGIHRIDQPHYLDAGAQVIELGKLDPTRLDPRLRLDGLEKLRNSNALIVNVDYPLGMAAYSLFSQISSSVPDILGVYIMGKAATLNGRVGDVMIPNVVFDEHSKNTYLFKNCFCAHHVSPFLGHGSVFDNQKAVTVRGTLLQNKQFMAVFYKEGYTDIEMEAGPYLSAVYEDIYPNRYPVNEIVNLFINAPYDLGILHYASDTPYSRRQSLLSKSLSYFGVDATYATSAAIMRRILANELDRLDRQA